MTAIENGAPAAEPVPAEKKWRRLSLWALAILLPATLAETGYQPAKALLAGDDLIARDVAAGDTGAFRRQRLAPGRHADHRRQLPASCRPMPRPCSSICP